MSRRPFLFFLGLAVMAAMTLPTWAKSNSNASIKATIELGSTTKLGAATLNPGQYDVVVQGNQAKFEQEGKIVAEVPCSLKTLPNKARQTEVLSDQDRMTEIQVSGKTEAIDFSPSLNSGN